MVLAPHLRHGGEQMKVLQIGSVLAATALMTIFPVGKSTGVAAEVEINRQTSRSLVPSFETNQSSQTDSTAFSEEEVHSHSPGSTERSSDLSYLAFYPYAELPPARKPADVVLESLSDVPIGTPLEEIKRATDAFGLDFSFMRTVAKIESDFNPKQRTGSYVGLFQLSNAEFTKYGSGEITSPRDNAIAAAYKFTTEAVLFESDTHKRPTFSDLYLIHQQGWQGAAEHVSQPDRIAWKSMCATEEGREKGEKWCKLAIWLNTLPTIKHIWKSVNNLTSGAFVAMWRERVDRLYALYSEGVFRETTNAQEPRPRALARRLANRGRDRQVHHQRQADDRGRAGLRARRHDRRDAEETRRPLGRRDHANAWSGAGRKAALYGEIQLRRGNRGPQTSAA